MSVSGDPKSPPALLLLTKNLEDNKIESMSIAVQPTEVATTEIVLVDPAVVRVLKCLPYNVFKMVESKLLSILQVSWANIKDADKTKILSIFTTLGADKQVSLRLRNIVNEITEDGKIDMDDLPHITELIVTLIEIFQDMKMPSKSDHLIVPVFEFLVMIIVASSLNNPDELDKWAIVIRSALRLVSMQVRKANCCNCF